MSDRIEAIIDALRKKLLDAAVRGELVDQNDEEEPASALLERIAAERSRLIREKKIKKPKSSSRIERRDGHFYESVDGSTPVCIDDELPFEIPSSWEWVRLSSMGTIVGGGTPSTSDPSLWDGGVPWITPADMRDLRGKYVSHGSKYISPKGVLKSSAKELPPGSVVFSSRAPIGYVAIAETALYTNQGFKSVAFNYDGLSDYVYYSLIALTDDIKHRASGTTFAEISGTEFGKTLIPLPPLQEQHRIVDALERQLKQLDILRESHRRMRRILHETPTSLRQQLLQAAIEGKLVAQNPKEEPASALLERIAKERAALPGKRKAAPPSRIERRPNGTFELFPDGSEKNISDEIPFDIPERWEWVRLKYIFSLLNGDRGNNYPSKDKLSREGGIPFISAVNIQRQSVDNNNLCYLSSEQFNRLRAGKLQKGDIVICIRGSLGKYCFYPFEEGAIASSLIIARANFKVKRYYFQAYMETLFFYFAKIYKNGTAQPNLSASCLGDFLFPFPPDKEQVRIENYLKSIIETDMFKSIKSF